SIKVLQDHEATRKAILEGVAWLTQPGGDDGARLFHYSGHGTQKPDTSSDEKDGRDECIVPVDCDVKNGAFTNLIVDDELRALYAKTDKKNHLLLIMDSCHSGTVEKDLERKINYRFLKPPKESRQKMREIELRVYEARQAAIEKQLEKRIKELGDHDSVEE